MYKYLEMRNITKKFNENLILDNIEFSVEKGQVHALIGENGSGKTTLMKILAGVYSPNSGEILINGRQVVIQSPAQAQDLGISMIYQDIMLFPDLSVAENIFIKREPFKRGLLKRIDWDKVYSETKKYLKAFGLDISPRTQVGHLSYGQQKFVEIIKALSLKSDILIMDETTAALTESEIQTLFEAIREIKKLGVTVIYISHRLEEIAQIADTVTVLRDGRVVRSCSIDQVDMKDIIQVMAGKEIKDRYPKIRTKLGKDILRVNNLSYNGVLRNINLNLRRGEILGIAGLSGSGRKTLAKTLFGINSPFEGTVQINGRTFKNLTTKQAMHYGLCYVAGTGTEESLIKQMQITKNITITNLKRVSKVGFLNPAREYDYSTDLVERLIISSKGNESVGNLSGGNQKKVTLAKWLFNNAKILIIDEPTAGIDIGSKVDIYNIINELVLSGASVIMISSDFPELIGMCDRIAVMYNGEIRKVLNRNEATPANILYFASGGFEDI